MRLPVSTSTGKISRAGFRRLSRFAGHEGGNIAMSFALLAVPVLLAMGASVDYVRAYNTKSRMQGDLDAALIAAVKEVDSLDEDLLKTKVTQWFTAQAETGETTYSLSLDTIKISKTNRTIQAIATGHMPTTFMGLANINSIDVSVITSVSGPATSFMNVYIVIDKSASMMLAATAAGQKTMRNSPAGCVFGCHTPEGGPWKFNNVNYSTNYALAKAMGVTLRSDVAVTAAQEVLDMVSKSDPNSAHIKVGLYSIGDTAKEVMSPSKSMSSVKKKLLDDSNGLTSATSQSTSYFDVSMTELAKLVGNAGDGSSSSKPLKLVLMLTDGVQSNRNWVQSNNISKNTTPLNPDWCKSMKTAGATIGVLYTEYLPMTWDWGYNVTVGEKMKNSYFTSVWGGTIDSSASANITRLDYIPYALKACASSTEMFISAADQTAVEEGLSALLDQYLGSVRLTQ